MPVLGSLNSAANNDIMSKMCQNEYLWSKGLTLSQTTKFSTLPNSKSSQRTTFSSMKVVESSPKGRKHCEKRRNDHCK